MLNLKLGAWAIVAGINLASGIEWRELSVTASGGTWSIAKGSGGTGQLGTLPARVALVRLERADGQATVYRAHVPAMHCGKPRGDIVLVSTEGEMVADTFDTARPGTAAVMLAAAVCSAAV